MSFFEVPGSQGPARQGAVAQTIFLQGLTAKEWSKLYTFAEIRSFASGEELVRTGDADDAFYVMTAGSAQVLQGADVIGQIAEGSVFGEVAFFDRQPRSATIRAIEAGSAARFSRASFEIWPLGNRCSPAACCTNSVQPWPFACGWRRNALASDRVMPANTQSRTAPVSRFRPYTEMASTLSPATWQYARITVLAATVACAVYLCVDGPRGLMLFWQLLVPSLPLLFAAAPGLWRQVCPMAFANQLPVEQGWSRGASLSPAAQDFAYIAAVAAFAGAIVLRRPWFSDNAFATAGLILVSLALALAGGLVFKGRSGWCGTFCPLGPLQKTYGHAPPVVVPNGYCPTCVGCQRNCYDFNPNAALHADLNELPPQLAGHRAFFAALLPGLILGAWLADPYGQHGPGRYYLEFGGYLLGSLGAFYAARSLLPISQYRLTAAFGLGAFVLFYVFEAAPMAGAVSAFTGLQLPYPATSYAVTAGAGILAVAIFRTGVLNEAAYIREHDAARGPAGLGVERVALEEGRRAASRAAIRERASGRTFGLDPGRSLLEILEGGGVKLDFGCRAGICGADPVSIVDGAEHLNAADANERATLQRLGLDGRARMACVCRASGPVEIEVGSAFRSAAADAHDGKPDLARQRGIDRVVILGNGVAGSTAAQLLRRDSATCRIDLVTRESHHFYNRMALGRVIGGRSGLEGLHLMPTGWFEQRRIDVWLNTQASRIDAEKNRVVLGTGEVLSYDRLILAMGSEASMPDVPGRQLPGSFVLREADDAMRLRSWVQSSGTREAVVAGGGALGVEAAAVLAALGLRVTIVHHADRLLNRQLDTKGAGILERFLAGKGIAVRLAATIEELTGRERLESVRLSDGTHLDAGLCLVCTGVTPRVALAEAAGLTTCSGVVVDANMRTSRPEIYAIGDIAENEKVARPAGLWTVGAQQAELAVADMLGRPPDTLPAHHVLHLKVDGIDVKAFGGIDAVGPRQSLRIDPEAGDNEQRRLIVEDGRIVGAIVVGPPGTAKSFDHLLAESGRAGSSAAESGFFNFCR